MKLFKHMSMAHGRQFFRNRTTAFGGFVLPLVFLAVFILSGMSTGGHTGTMQVMFSVALYFMIASVCFFGTVSPIIALRERGVVTLLGTTPLPRIVFLASMIPVRMLVGTALISIALIIGAQLDIVTDFNWELLVALLATVAFLLPLGLLMGAFLRSVEASNNALSLVLMFTTFIGGALVPMTALPNWIESALGYLPPSRVFDLLLHALVGLPLEYTWSGNLIVVGGGAVVLSVLAMRFFSWAGSS